MKSTIQCFQKTRQMIVVKAPDRLPKEKLSALVAQASAGAFMAADGDLQKLWLKQSRPQVVLMARNEEDFRDFLAKVERRSLSVYRVPDLAGSGIACLGIGPSAAVQVDELITVFDFYKWVRQNAFKGMLLSGAVGAA